MRTIFFLSIALWLNACAAVPNLRVAYLPPRADITLSVTETISCSDDVKTVSVSFVVDPAIKYTADDTPTGRRQLRYFNFARHDGAFADTQITLHVTEDGRLSSLNASSTSQTAAVVTAAIDLGKAATIASGATRQALLRIPTIQANTLCGPGGLIPAGKNLALKYIDRVAWPLDPRAPAPLTPAPGQKALVDRMRQAGAGPIPVLHLSFERGNPPAILSVADPKSTGNASSLCERPEDTEVICLRRVHFVYLAVTVPEGEVWSQTFPVPYGAPDLPVPVPTSQVFGKIVTDLTVADSGAITQIGYTKSTGTAELLAALAAIITFGAIR